MKKEKGFLYEFKEFISRGSVVDLAVGIIIGGAFTTIVNSLVNDMVMPVVGWALKGINFTEFKWVLSPAEGAVAAVTVNYGSFFQNVINFLLVSFVIFLLLKGINQLNRKKDAEPEKKEEAPDPQLELLREIRDLLKDSEK